MSTFSYSGATGSGWTSWNTGYSAGSLYAAMPRPQVSSSPVSGPSPMPTPVQPIFDPKIEANALYGKPMALAAIGSKPVRFGGSPAPLVGPYISAGLVDFLVSIALVVPVDGSRKLFKVYLDQELAWSSATGWDGSGAQPGDAVYHAETFDLAFRPGTITQDVLSLETEKFPGDENAYRPQVLIQIRNLPYQRYMDRSGRPVPYVSCEIGDFSNGRGPDEQINLGEALELIAHSPWAGYTSSTFEAVGITDAIDGIIIKDNFTVVDLCRSVTRIYRNIDLLQSDKLRVKDRGNVSPDFIFDRDSIIGGDNPIQIIRAGATAQRRQLELIAIGPDQDYTAVPSLAQIPRDPFVISAAVGKETIPSPIVMDASTRQALVTYAQQYEENARKKIAFKVRAFGYEIEPGDLCATVDVQDGIDNEVWKVTQTLHGANFVVEIEAEAILRCSLFAGAGSDDYFSYVILLLGGEGADGSTTFTDESPSLRGAGTVSGNTQVDTAEFKYGAASILFDGTGDALDWPDLGDAIDFQFGSGAFTIEMFIRPASVTGTRFFMGQWQASGDLGWVLYQNGATLTWSMTPDGLVGSQINIAGGTIVINTWQHAAFDFDGTTYRLYLDGVVTASSTSVISIHPSIQDVALGSNSGQTSFFYSGHMDEVRVTKGVARYAGAFTPPTAAFPRF